MKIETLEIPTETYSYQKDMYGEIYDEETNVVMSLDVPGISFIELIERLTKVKKYAKENNAKLEIYYTKNVTPYENSAWIYFESYHKNTLFNSTNKDKMYILKLNDFNNYYCVVKYEKKSYPNDYTTGTLEYIDQLLQI